MHIILQHFHKLVINYGTFVHSTVQQHDSWKQLESYKYSDQLVDSCTQHCPMVGQLINYVVFY